MSASRTYAEQACRFSQLSAAASTDEERELLLGIALGYLRLAKSAADLAVRGWAQPVRGASAA